MSLYFLTFLLVTAGGLLEWAKPQHKEKIYWICWSAMAAVLSFRYGQGTDYVTYEAIYATIPAVIDLSQGYICGFYPEIGWRLISALFKFMEVPFWVFTMTLGLANMLLLHRFLAKYVPMKTLGLFFSYPVLYIVYMVSGLRQGLAMCFFLGVLIPLYLEKKWFRYVLSVLVAGSFHKVGYTWIILPIAYYLPIWVMTGLTVLAAVVGAVIQIEAVELFIYELLPIYHVQQFLLEGNMSLFALAERTLSFCVLFALYWWVKKEHGAVEKHAELLFKVYICGVCFYMLMSGNAYYASRYAVIFKIVEGAILISLIAEKRLIQKIVFFFFVLLTLVMGYKNLNAMITEGGYSDQEVSVWNFPYVSVFDRDEMKEYHDYEQLLQNIYENNIEDQQLWMIEK